MRLLIFCMINSQLFPARHKRLKKRVLTGSEASSSGSLPESLCIVALEHGRYGLLIFQFVGYQGMSGLCNDIVDEEAGNYA